MRKAEWAIFVILPASLVLFSINILARSPIVGTIATAMFLGSVSTILGTRLYRSENQAFRFAFGIFTVLMLLSIVGVGLIVLGQFTEIASLLTLIVVYVVLTATLGKKENVGAKPQDTPPLQPESAVANARNTLNYALVLPFIISVVSGFLLLFLSRTGEGGASVWLSIPSVFTIVYLICAFLLFALVFFSKINDSVKLVLILIFSLLSHSFFLIVWYPGRYGDPWSHLAEARYILRTGRPYAYAQILQSFLVVDLFKFRAQYSLVVFFERMFYVDIYWIHILIVPVLWSLFTPIFAYKTAATLGLKRSKSVPFLAALVTMIFPSLIIWGAVSVPNSIGFLFFFATVAFVVLWIKRSERRLWMAALLSVMASLLSHPQPGAFALMLLLLATVVQKTSRRIVWIASFISVVAVYPIALYSHSTILTLEGLWQINNFLAFQSEISTLLLIFGLIGVVAGIKSRVLDPRPSFLVLVFYGVILGEYYFTKYGMSNLPYGAGRILAIADFLLVPFVAVGLRAVLSFLGKDILSPVRNPFRALLTGRTSSRTGTRVLGICLVFLFLSLQATIILYQAYPQDEIVKVQPSSYELEAIRFIDGDSGGRYVVLCEPGFASLASGFLGSDYSYYGSGRGVYGVPEFWYPTVKMYLGMAESPSIGYMQQAMDFADAGVSYFVISKRNPNLESVAKRTLDVLPAYGVFGDGSLYVFKYPLLPKEEPGTQVRVVFDDGSSSNVPTTYSYIVESEINATLNLSGHASYNVTDFPQHWTFLSLSVNNIAGDFDESSNIDSFVYIRDLEPSDIVLIRFLFDKNYENVGWKEDSFKRQWNAHPLYSGIKEKPPSIIADGNVLSLSYSFVSGDYWYYYHTTTANISTNEYPYMRIRWRCLNPIAVSSVYFEAGTSYEIIPLGSQSLSWVTTTVQLPRDSFVNTVMVGLNNARNRQFSGYSVIEVDFILFAAKA